MSLSPFKGIGSVENELEPLYSIFEMPNMNGFEFLEQSGDRFHSLRYFCQMKQTNMLSSIPTARWTHLLKPIDPDDEGGKARL